jgi:FkbM family methyltransferase
MQYMKKIVKKISKKIGIEIKRYNNVQSIEARIRSQLKYHEIDCVIDVGANDGGYGKFLRSSGFNGLIISFEPQALAHSKLLETSHRDPAWIIAPQMALGNVKSMLEINLAGNSTSSSILPMLPSHLESAPSSKYIGKEIIEVNRLDQVNIHEINIAKKIYLKIDTQGYEKLVLLGANGIMDKIIGIQLEMSIIPLYDGQALYQELLKLLNDSGFEMWGITPGFMNQETGRMLQFDGIFFRQ